MRSVKALKAVHPNTPVILTEEANENLKNLKASQRVAYKRVNNITRLVLNKLRKMGVNGIYLLTADEIGLYNQNTVEGTHPNDSGTQKYANAYNKKIHEIFSESGKHFNQR